MSTKIHSYEKLITYYVYLHDLKFRLNELSRWAAEKQQIGNLRIKERLDVHAKPLKIVPGDYVYVKKEIRTHKFEKFYEYISE